MEMSKICCFCDFSTGKNAVKKICVVIIVVITICSQKKVNDEQLGSQMVAARHITTLSLI